MLVLFAAVQQSVKSELDRQSTLHNEAENRVREADLSLKAMQAKSKQLIEDLQGKLEQQATAKVGSFLYCVHVSPGLSQRGCQLLDLMFYLKLRSDYNMHVERLLPANLCLKLGRMFAIWKIPPATRSNCKQNTQFQNKIGNDTKVSRVNRITLWCLTFPRSRQPTCRYKLLLGEFWAQEVAPSF